MKGNILIVDDDASCRSSLEALLRDQGFTVSSVADGKKALENFTAFQPDIILLDVVLPEVSGFEVCRRVKHNPATRLVPVVLVTGLSQTEDRVRGLEAGADDFLSKPLDRSELLARVRSLVSLKNYTDELERAELVLFALARSIEGKDPYTQGHCERLADYAVRLGNRLGMPTEDITALRRAGNVHDIGKVAVPDAILLKRGPLTRREAAVMREHPVVGERICAPLKSFRHVLPIIRHHHEKFNGSGYPDGLRGEEIPLTARVLQVVDVYDALITDRPYKRALPMHKAISTMAREVERGWWDRRVFSEFRRLLIPSHQDHRQSSTVSLAHSQAPPTPVLD